MIRIIIGAVAGFVIWSILWVGSDTLFMAISSSYRQYLESFNEALQNQKPFTVDNTILFLTLVKSFICSIIAGFMTAVIARENTKSTVILGILLLAFGIFIQSVYWNYLPLWYHLLFLLLLLPMSFLGGKLKKIQAVHNF